MSSSSSSNPPQSHDSESGRPKAGFGTFAGVYTPSILTILGVIMYLRLGWVTGQAGLGGALVIIVLAHLISLSTGLSISSIATNRTVGAGGAYFMISRALGAPTGAAIGIPLFIAQALSVTFYAVGFAESVHQILPTSMQAWLGEAHIATAMNVLLTVLSFLSADLAIRAQYFVMAAIALSLVSFFSGTSAEFPMEIEWFASDGASFAQVFAVFFPAVTGILAGVGMSGDLKNPRRSIPRGTMSAIGTGFVIYMAFAVWLALSSPVDAMRNDFNVAFGVARYPLLIYVGVWGATLSSALGSILTAPRTLAALADDSLMPRFFGRLYGPTQEPRVGIILTFVLAQVGIFLGDLDSIAPVLTMFFLVTYGVTNVACGLQKWAANPSFRPSFSVPATVSLAGGFGCFYVMSVIDVVSMAAALVVSLLIFLIVQRRTLGTTYGDARHGIWAALVRSALYRLRRSAFHPQNWRPNLVILGGNPSKRTYLLQLGSSIVQERGVVTYYHLLPGAVDELAEERRELLGTHDAKIAEHFPHVYYRVDIVEDVYRATVAVAQAYGIGSFEANSIMLGWPKKPERSESYVQMLRDLVALDRSLLLVRHHSDRHFGYYKSIHVWWGGPYRNGSLMLLLAFLLTADDRWRRARVTVLTVVSDEHQRAVATARLQEMLEQAHLDAELRVILRSKSSILEIMRSESSQADLAILGFRLPREGENVEPFFERMQQMLDILPTALMVHSAYSFTGESVLFDDSSMGPSGGRSTTYPPRNSRQLAAG